MSQTINIKDIPGYNPEVDYNLNFGHECILQATYHFSWGSEVAFYNRQREEIKRDKSTSNVAVWHIKQLH